MDCILSIDKYSSTNYCVVSQIVTYQIIITNNSNNTAEDVVVKDLLAEELKFILGSVRINAKEYSYTNITSGIKLGTLIPHESKTIIFDAQIIKKNNDFIENKAIVEFKYEEDGIYTCDCYISEINKICVKDPNLTIIKKVDKDKVQLEDEITYILNVINDGDLDLYNVYLIDKIPNCVEIIDGSFSVNCKVINSVEIEKGIMLDNIARGESAIIKYSVKVVSGAYNGRIPNKAKVVYSYALPNCFTAQKESAESILYVDMCISSFNQINIDEYLSIPITNPEICDINDLLADVKINKYNVIKTVIAKSTEGQILSGYKLIIHGTLNQTVEYIADEVAQTIHSASYSMPFSSYIVLPSDFIIGSKIEIDASVEEVYFNKVDTRSIFKNILILLTAKITCSDKSHS